MGFCLRIYHLRLVRAQGFSLQIRHSIHPSSWPSHSMSTIGPFPAEDLSHQPGTKVMNFHGVSLFLAKTGDWDFRNFEVFFLSLCLPLHFFLNKNRVVHVGTWANNSKSSSITFNHPPIVGTSTPAWKAPPIAIDKTLFAFTSVFSKQFVRKTFGVCVQY